MDTRHATFGVQGDVHLLGGHFKGGIAFALLLQLTRQLQHSLQRGRRLFMERTANRGHGAIFQNRHGFFIGQTLG